MTTSPKKAKYNWLIPPVLPPNDLPLKLREELVRSLYGQKRSILEGSLVLLIVALACWIHTGSPWFILWAAADLFALSLRMILVHFYEHKTHIGIPDDWARRFALSSFASALVWGVGCLVITIRVHDPIVVLFATMSEMGWVSAAACRNQISPAAAMSQIIGPLLPTAIGFLINDAPLYRVIGALLFIQIGGNIGISEYLRNQTLGLLNARKKQGELMTQLESTCAKLETTCAKYENTCAELEIANARLQNLSATDGLTGIPNRRALDTALQIEWARSAREGVAISLLMLDVDWFKAFNDLYGHLSGDDCLCLIARTLETTLRRPPDFAARFGGEEFMAILPGADQRGALEAAERVRNCVLELAIPHSASQYKRVTISVGVATVIRPEADSDPQILIAASDRALYCAKERGRNNVCVDPAIR